MDRNDKWNSVIFLGQNAAQMSVPRVTVNQVGIDVRGVEIRTTTHCAKNRAQRFRAGEMGRVDFKTDDPEVALFQPLIAKATHFHRHHLRQLTREIAHMHASAAVNVRRILVSQKEDFHPPRVEQASGLLSTEFARGTLR